ncbi:hypothetical protein STHU_45160 [Allostella humosa]|nr:hypothetical protein STHU_45160 [Stella humosa]
MTMSWVADRKATASAAMAVSAGSTAGSVRPSRAMAAMRAAWTASVQPRRRPKRPVRTGRGRLSTSGAQRNFRL